MNYTAMPRYETKRPGSRWEPQFTQSAYRYSTLFFDSVIQAGSFEKIWKSDHLIPRRLRERLKTAVAPLENVPESEKDWHPGSNGQVLDLVHPSLYPIVYNRTPVRRKGAAGSVTLEAPLAKDIAPLTFALYPNSIEKFVSKRFQWLPSDFAISDTGKVSLSSPYINNIHPIHHADLYTVILDVLERALPMFERVLSDLRRPLLPMRIKAIEVGYRVSDKFECAPCLWDDYHPWPERDGSSSPGYTQGDWFWKRDPHIPQGRPYNGDLEKVRKTVSLNGQTVQCIVKLANIVLTPENPEYLGGKWHVEGKPSQLGYVG